MEFFNVSQVEATEATNRKVRATQASTRVSIWRCWRIIPSREPARERERAAAQEEELASREVSSVSGGAKKWGSMMTTTTSSRRSGDASSDDSSSSDESSEEEVEMEEAESEVAARPARLVGSRGDGDVSFGIAYAPHAAAAASARHDEARDLFSLVFESVS